MARALLESLPLPEVAPTAGGVLAARNGFWVMRWIEGEVEDPEAGWPRTEWRAVLLEQPVAVWGVTFPAGMRPVRPLQGGGVLVLLEDSLGRQGVGLAQLKELRDG